MKNTRKKRRKPQIVLIHGGEAFKTRKEYVRFLKNRKVSVEKWRGWSGEYLDEKLGGKFQIIRPRMPLQDNARYGDWEIHFERYLPHLRDGVILIGSSLGGVFLAQYLSRHAFPRNIAGAFLVAPPFDSNAGGDEFAGGFPLKGSLRLFEKQAKNLHLFFSRDDAVVPPAHAEKYRAKLPHAKITIYKSKRGHFRVATFPEIVKAIKAAAEQPRKRPSS